MSYIWLHYLYLNNYAFANIHGLILGFEKHAIRVLSNKVEKEVTPNYEQSDEEYGQAGALKQAKALANAESIAYETKSLSHVGAVL